MYRVFSTSLSNPVSEIHPKIVCRTYAPLGVHSTRNCTNFQASMNTCHQNAGLRRKELCSKFQNKVPVLPTPP